MVKLSNLQKKMVPEAAVPLTATWDQVQESKLHKQMLKCSALAMKIIHVQPGTIFLVSETSFPTLNTNSTVTKHFSL